MTNASIYKDIAKRTGGDIYIGVVGPVRTGKSTFIKQFMDKLVLPNIAGGETANDSAAGVHPAHCLVQHYRLAIHAHY